MIALNESFSINKSLLASATRSQLQKETQNVFNVSCGALKDQSASINLNSIFQCRNSFIDQSRGESAVNKIRKQMLVVAY
jgi:hypothetical protein